MYSIAIQGKYMNKRLKDKQVNIRLTDAQYSDIENKSQKAKFSSISEFLRNAGLNYIPEVCRSYLFSIEIPLQEENTELSNVITCFFRNIQIDLDSITITFIFDNKNIWKTLIESKTNFKIWWLTTKGEKIDYYEVDYKKFPNVKIFPLRFGHDLTDEAIGMAVLKT